MKKIKFSQVKPRQFFKYMGIIYQRSSFNFGESQVITGKKCGDVELFDDSILVTKIKVTYAGIEVDKNTVPDGFVKKGQNNETIR